MKKSILLFVAFVFLSSSFVYAQEDTTDVKSKDPTRDMIQVTANDLPDAVKERLKSSAYRGWASAEIFRSEDGDRFLIRIDEDEGQKKSYYFSKDGDILTGPGN